MDEAPAPRPSRPPAKAYRKSRCRTCRKAIRIGETIDRGPGTRAWVHEGCVPPRPRRVPSLRTLHAEIHQRMLAFRDDGGPPPDLLREHDELVGRMRRAGIRTRRGGNGGTRTHDVSVDCGGTGPAPRKGPGIKVPRVPPEIVAALRVRHGSVHHAMRLALELQPSKGGAGRALLREHEIIIDQMRHAGIAPSGCDGGKR